MHYRKIDLASILLVFTIITGCESTHQADEIKTVIQNTKVHFVPDSRVDRFEVEGNSHSDRLVLSGETTLPEAKSALLDSLSAQDISAVDSIEILPSATLEGQTFGLINNSVGNIRSQPEHSAQLATQALLGMPLEVLKKDGGWYLVQTPDDYIGWIDSGGLVRMKKAEYEKWKNAEKLIYLDTYGFSYERSSLTDPKQKVSDLVAGSILKLEGRSGSFYRVSYPDGRKALVSADEAKPYHEWQGDLNITQASLVETAKTMMGAPYLWGGTSTKGIDCSGFTKTIYFMNGVVIPRDASQQVHAGRQVDTQKNFENLEVGDLLFFGRPAAEGQPQRVVHVGMWIGDSQFIHSSGRVRISSVDSTADNFDPYNLGRYLETRRYLKNWEGNIAQTKEMYDQLDDE